MAGNKLIRIYGTENLVGTKMYHVVYSTTDLEAVIKDYSERGNKLTDFIQINPKNWFVEIWDNKTFSTELFKPIKADENEEIFDRTRGKRKKASDIKHIVNKAVRRNELRRGGKKPT